MHLFNDFTQMPGLKKQAVLETKKEKRTHSSSITIPHIYGIRRFKNIIVAGKQKWKKESL